MVKTGSIKYILRKRIKIFAVVVVILSCIYICYQLFYLGQLNEQLEKRPIPTSIHLIRGINPKEEMYYRPTDNTKFMCIQSNELIDFSQINDDYCDCLDGSDEPGTNACTNSKFFCLHQDLSGKHKKVLPSTMVNDGICDCCDGSDEWAAEQLPFRLDDLIQRKLGRYQTPCTNYCFK